MKKVRLIDQGKSLWFECPGCGENHGITVAGPDVPHPCWTWNGSFEAPTLMPSVMCKGFLSITDEEHDAYIAGAPLPPQKAYVCHSWVKDGMIQFLGDCTHELAGKTVPMIDLARAGDDT